MKRTLVSISILALLAFAALAQPTTQPPSITLAWDRTTDATVNGYRLYYGVASGVYTNSLPATGAATTTLTVSNLTRGVTYYFAATCVSTNGLESAYSAEVTYRTLTIPLPPVNLRATVNAP